MHYLDSLNAAQKAAVEALDGPVLVLAGAGTGKTRVLTARLAHLLNTGRAMPGDILAVTFTNKAAQEMRERVGALVGGPVDGWWIGTFHALAARMLRRHADLAGLTSAFTIIDPDDSLRLIKQLMEARGIDIKQTPPKLVRERIDRWKDRALPPSAISDEETGGCPVGTIAVRVYADYQDRLRTLNACDFGDLLLHLIRILQNPANAAILESWHRRFRYILVDEYQDTNVAQYLWLRLLAAGSRNICVVGDDDQSIYGWRGAEVGNILRFEKDFEGAAMIRLEDNYRSTAAILACADSVIAHNQGRLGKTLRATIGAGDPVVVRGLWDGEAEARWIGEQVESLVNGPDIPNDKGRPYAYGGIAVLVRAGFQMREIEERFMTMALPYRVVGGPRFYERQEIRDALAYLRVIAQPYDDLALERILNTPKRGIGQGTVHKLYAYARAERSSLSEAIRAVCASDEFRPKQRQVLSDLMNDFDRWRTVAQTATHTELAGIVLDESGYTAMWQAEKTPEAQGRLENLRELVSAMADYESLEAFLEHVALVMEAQEDNSADKVNLMTLHGAKGLEFGAVFLPGWEEGVFPSQRSMEESGVKGLEEERRLAYVGLTRARRRAFISHAANRRTYGQWTSNVPSRFIEELPGAPHCTVSSEVQQRSMHWDSSGHRPVPAAVLLGGGDRRGEDEGGLSRGVRVRHAGFGEGKIINIDGNKLDIDFDGAGRKRILAAFVEPCTPTGSA